MPEFKDTTIGLLRRTGPASAELLDQDTGQVYGFNFAAAAEYQVAGLSNGRELADEIYRESKGGGEG